MTDDRARWAQIGERYYAGAMTEADWTSWQDERLPVVLSHVMHRSPFYRHHLDGTDPATVTSATLSRLPVTTKADLRSAMSDVLSGPVSESAIYYETTGTTGASTPCPRSALEIATSNAHVRESWRRLFADRFGGRPPTIALMGPSELYAFCDTFGDVAQDLDLAHVKLWPESPRVGFAKALRLLADLRVDVVVCAPALCLNLAKAALHHGYDLERDFAISQFLVLGEICTPAFRENVQSVWGAEVLPTLYGSQEALAIATGCGEGNLHLSRPNYVAEVLDPAEGHSLGHSGQGELCLTMLAPGIKPLIRYRTGDHVSVTPDGCTCGHPGPVVDVVGRVEDGLSLGGRRVQPADLETAVLDGVRGCLGYQIVVDGPAGSEAVTVRLDLLTGTGQDAGTVRGGIACRLRELCGVEVDIAVDAELDPITNTGAFVSWKAARIEDRRVSDDPHVATARRNATQHLVST